MVVQDGWLDWMISKASSDLDDSVILSSLKSFLWQFSLYLPHFRKADFLRTREQSCVLCLDSIITYNPRWLGDFTGGSSQRAKHEPYQDRKLWDMSGRHNCYGAMNRQRCLRGNSICLCQTLEVLFFPPHSAFSVTADQVILKLRVDLHSP